MGTCIDTYSTLRIFSDESGPEEITNTLGVEPTSTFKEGDVHGLGRLRRKTNGWFYSTKSITESKVDQHHLDLVLDVLDGKTDAVDALRERGCKIDIVTYWVSSGQGGPSLLPEQMLKLGALGISIWWDIYFSETLEKLPNPKID